MVRMSSPEKNGISGVSVSPDFLTPMKKNIFTKHQ